ncbi:HAMP domain-containing sensor histidine kinase [Fusibacter bizertensis]|uniref:histidine kinase n=1 Tax=Fusibacter bizertensis TaxID=1488331 RepID=A0ABT6NDM2_9FIRM|nr:HAMP domain-containing sensor histidine kinase [Fusibacter bizertensis]MDH8678528.1 HAMP domain-containing sensor histidine kinase [Fusibacter bizertensis]
MKQNKFTLRGLIILFMIGMTLITTVLMMFLFANFDIRINEHTTLIKNPYLWLAVFMVIVIVFFMILVLLINKYIFDPIFAMKRAAEHIKSGNLNYPIQYKADNEIGDFCNEFDKMRVRLRDTILEQHEIEKRRKRLIASITHDLRTPLTSIKGYVEAIQDGIVKDQETYEKYLSTIAEKADHLNHLIDDLSVYTKQELGEFTLNLERVNSGKILASYFDHKVDEFKYSNIDLILYKPFISTFINVDPYRFNQILENLIGNAKKYAHTKIEVRTKVVNYHLQIAIQDDGDGIPQDVLASIFDPFFMVNKVKDQKEKGGSGLGLAIVKQLTERHEGKITVESNVDEGTTFVLDFPLDI